MYKKRDNKYNIDNLFSIPTKNKEITISHWPVVESLSRIAFRVVLFCALFLFFNQLGEWLSAKEWFFTRGGFDTSFLYSMFLLPLLHSLRDIVHCFDSCWTDAYIVNDSIVVKRGLTYTAYDKLYVKDINNIKLNKNIYAKGNIKLKDNNISIQNVNVEKANGDIKFDTVNTDAKIVANIGNLPLKIIAKTKKDFADIELDIPKLNPNFLISEVNSNFVNKERSLGASAP